MSLSSTEIWQRISAEGLASSLQCRSWAAETAKHLDGADSTNGLKVLQKLVELGQLTNYQAKIIAGQSDAPLRKGAWHILQRCKSPLWEGWLEITKIDPTKAAAPSRWAKWFSGEEIQKFESSSPALTRGIKLANIDSQPRSLQHVHIPELESGELLLQLSPTSGRLLSEAFKTQSATTEQSTAIVKQIAEALSALHRNGITHTRVFPDRIYWDGEKATLVVDPISAICSSLEEATSGILGSHVQSPASFLAPEFLAPAQLPTQQTDVYALGATWWWLCTGKLLATGESPQSTLAKASEGRLISVEETQLAEPLHRVLAHCVASNPQQRFASASQLHAAILAAEQLVAQGKTAKKHSHQPDSKSQASMASTPTHFEGMPAATSSTEEVVKPSPASDKPAKLAAKLETESRPNELASEKTVSPSKKKPKSAKPASTAADSSESSSVAKPTSSQLRPKVAKKSAASSKSKPVSDSTQEQSRKTPTPVDEIASVSSAPLSSGESKASAPTTRGERANVGNDSTSKPAPAKGSSKGSKKRKKRGSNKWMVPVFGGAGFLVLLLALLQFSGALTASNGKKQQTEVPPYVPPEGTGKATLVEKDPREEYYVFAEGTSDLWVPPYTPNPLPLDLLPPGAGCFVALKPQSLLSSQSSSNVLATFPEQIQNWKSQIEGAIQVPLRDVAQLVIGLYPPESEGAFPLIAYRVELVEGQTLTELRTLWQNPSLAKFAGHDLYTNDDKAFFIAQTESEDIKTFSVGPISLMQEVAEMNGASGPLFSDVEKLWSTSSKDSQLTVLAAAPFLFAEGREVVSRMPSRLQNILRRNIGSQTKAARFQMDFTKSWYTEFQIIGSSAQAAGGQNEAVKGQVASASNAVESWFVSQSPHPYWRAIAFRFPQMLRTVQEYSRFGVEEGVAIANCYLPAETAPSLLVAVWTSLQDAATVAGGLADTNTGDTAPPLSIDEYLNRPVKISFASEPIEVALQLIGEEANDGLPPGTPKLRFELDGDAFESDGITRNQGITDFDSSQKPVRFALTEISKRGNPVPGVTDTTIDDQKLIWVVKDDPQSPGNKMISLTTRTAANKAGISLPTEFAK